MAERTDELRNELQDQRERIGTTVDQIENRVRPDRIVARGRYRLRRRVIDWKDQIMGNDQPYYPDDPRYSRAASASDSGWEAGGDGTSPLEGAKQKLEQIGDQVSEAPEMLRRQTRGNPVAAGLIAMGAGLLLGSVLPQTRPEKQAARRIQPMVEDAASDVAEKGREMADDLKESASSSVDKIKAEAGEAAEEVKQDARESAQRLRDDSN